MNDYLSLMNDVDNQCVMFDRPLYIGGQVHMGPPPSLKMCRTLRWYEYECDMYQCSGAFSHLVITCIALSAQTNTNTSQLAVRQRNSKNRPQPAYLKTTELWNCVVGPPAVPPLNERRSCRSVTV